MYGPYARVRVWKETAHLLLDLAVGIAFFTAIVTMLSVSLSLLVTLLGLPLLVATALAGRSVGVVERARAKALLDVDLAAFAPIEWTGGVWARVRLALTDQPGWKALAYGVLMLPWGIFTFTVAVVVWSVAWGMATLPLYAWALDDPPKFTLGDVQYHVHGAGLVAWTIAVGLIGWLLVAVVPLVIHGLASVDRALIRGLLSPSKEQQLERRVSELEVSREASVESSAGELRRIERDLHDGAQQRLVSVAMELGLAKEHLRENGDPRALELVTQAHDEAKLAIVELRDLVRGIHPAVLTDRGLDAAVSALIARCPVPVTLHADLPRRLPAATEAAAYFVVAEALTNVAKHSGARTAMVRLREQEGRLHVEIHDDGRGGAAETIGGGLHGLRDRVAGAEGRLRIASPVGGPTVVNVELPCGL
jgi:signal transduction histidine kinase